MELQTILDAVRTAPSILEGIRRAEDLAVAAERKSGVRDVSILAVAASDPADQLTAIAAVHALAQIRDGSADPMLLSFLSHDSHFLREHAAWALGARPPQPGGIPLLVGMVAGGGFLGMLAQRTLEEWSGNAPDQLALALEEALTGVADPGARARLVETAGRGPGRLPEKLLRRVAGDADESVATRVAAIEGLSDRRPNQTTTSMLTAIGRRTDVLSDVARLALFDLRPASRPASGRQAPAIAQLFLHADIDRHLSQVGAGDNGGIATLLVRLGDALVGQSQPPRGWRESNGRTQLERVVTISRGRHDDALSAVADLGSVSRGHSFATVPFLGEHVPMAQAWPRRIATQRGIHRILRAAEPIDAIHLRMADVGSLAAAAVARERGIPVVFTLAPDPHAVIDGLDASGALTRTVFGTVDEGQHFWFRTRLVQRIAADAARLVLFPRQNLERDLHTLLGVDLTGRPEGRYSVVAEGIDLAVIERSGTDARAASVLPFNELDDLLRSLPEDRRSLPLAISVGRLHRVKGMAMLVEAWATDPELRHRCNLLVVGGDLEHPSDDEQEQLDWMGQAVSLAGAPAQGLLLAGHRPNDTVARWLAAARYGRPGLAAPHGVYVCASVKEEFGIALLEAMATGLTVVAPLSGGPATYVEDAVTGFLVDTGDRVALAQGIRHALDFAAGPTGRAGAERARTMVAQNFTIEAMATALTDVYTGLAAPERSLVPEVSAW